MTSPLKPPEGNWWDVPVDRRETIYLSIAGLWSLVLFGWMSLYTRIGDQNPIGDTYRVDREDYQNKMSEYQEQATETEDGTLVPPAEDVYIAAFQYGWMGLPVQLETGKTYRMHISSLDVQHGFSIRPEENLTKQANLLVLPGYEFVIEMTFDEPGTYHVLCNEFCGVGHRSMHGTLEVVEG